MHHLLLRFDRVHHPHRSRIMQRNPQQPQVVVGVFDSRAQAEAALADLEGAGFPRSDGGLAARHDRGEWSEVARGAAIAGAAKAEQGAVAGVAAGAGVGSLWAVGIAAGVLPAIGPVVAGGILGSILASAATGAAAGGLAGALIGLGIPEE